MAEPKSKEPEIEQVPDEKGKPKRSRAASKPAQPAAQSAVQPSQPAAQPASQSAAQPATPATAWPAAGPDQSRAEAAKAEALATAEILAVSSEEFRDSLQTIRGALELLVSGKVHDEQKAAQFLQIAYRETGYLSHRVSDLHLATLIESDRLRLKLTTLSLWPMLEHLVQEAATAAAEQQIHLELKNGQELPNLQGDEALLRTALTNLLETALKSTPRQGSLLVRASGEKDQISVHIESRGPQQNGQGDRPDLEAAGGRSLALSIAGRIALAHEGQLQIYAAADAAQVLELILPLQPKTRRRGRILVVDDNPQAAFLLEYALQEDGYEPVKAMNGPDALKLARSERFDLIILDVLLPGIDGFEVCHRLRAAPETASIPVIMVSAKAREEDQSTALRIGADAYFGKPLSMAELTAAISDLLEAGNTRGRHGG
jgi:CheY-like chemotaxis protein